MKLTNSIKSIAIGSFDGVHLGHQALIKEAEAVVIIERNRSVMTAGYKRLNYINKPSFFYHLDKVKSLSARAFVDRLSEDFPKLETIVVGYDFGFGYKKEGDTILLQELFDGNVLVIDEVKHNGVSVHSRSIKEFIKNGEIRLANELLGHNYRIDGEVVSGQGLGKKELVPTLNLKIQNYLLPKEGVYATRTLINDSWLTSVSFFGHRVTTDGSFAVETHVLDRDIGVVEGNIELEFIAFIRDNQKFDGLDALRVAIEQDIERCRVSF
ncbi:bifunctional riboflavin kinase/FAD synthetase [Sulfurovum sp. bin170]|uniref:bifunctional riboflavin kinase/FAD synthetase n=1 Tax=Sulfurovum sp. bin170 TaxID=2695268 RepID=UPI0013E05B51|nr:bifunctional riboflavin kinase/FAD synthetase [Sulfurovum sp. bin170]NEW60967.1 bifunctional riboflavin kinase/FAD synthetase [Sulfurovum sp. bin170]